MAKSDKDKGGVESTDYSDYINVNAYRELRQAQEQRASEAKGEFTSPDTAEAMDAHFKKQDKERETEVNNYDANAKVRQALAAQQKDISSRGLKMGGFTPDYATRTNVGDGAAGIIAAGGRNYTPLLKIGATAQEMQTLMDMSGAMQRHRRLVKEYERRQKEKKKNDGGLTAARQRHKGLSFFPGRPMFKVGSIVFEPMSFDDGVPLVNLHRSCEEGWCAVGSGQTNTLERVQAQAGRAYRASQPRNQ